MTNFKERTNTLLYKNTSLTLYSRKGDISCVWEVSGDKDGLLFWPKVLVTIAALLPHLAGVAQPWVTEGLKPSVCRWLSIRHLVSNCLKPSVCWLYYCLTSTCFRCSSAYLHRCISWLTARSRVNILQSSHSYFSEFHMWTFSSRPSPSPSHTHILQIMLKDNNSKYTKRNYLNHSKKKKI